MSKRGPRVSDDPAQDAARETIWVRELLCCFHHLNQKHFKGVLRAPQLALVDGTTFYGRYLQQTRTVEISRRLLREQPWGTVLEVLKHELAHQFVHEVLQELEDAHGPAFKAVCKRLGIDARAAGLPTMPDDPSAAPAASREKSVLDRVHKLLALAESDNRHEAEAAAAAAQRLMLRHNIDAHARTEQSAYAFRHLGRITGRVAEWERRLGNILSTHFFVEVIWVPSFDVQTQKRGSVLEAIGSAENLELAAYVYAFLLGTAERAWDAHRRASGIAGQRDRLPYYAGIMSGFAETLEKQARGHAADGLLWVPHAGLHAYTRKRHPHLRTVATQGTRRNEAFSAGQQAGRSVLLHRGMTRGASGTVKLLPP